MKKFQFSLNTVLGYKQQVLDGLQNEHAILLRRVREQEQHLEEMKHSYQVCNSEFRTAEAEGMTVAEAMCFESGLRFWENEIAKATKQLVQYQKQAEAKRKEVVAARQDTASLEKLRDRKLEAYQKDVQKSEELFIEELVATQRVMATAMP